MENRMTTREKRELSKRIRREAGYPGSPYPIVEIEGDSPPKLRGSVRHYETLTGIRIYHPSAYSRKGWSSMRYVKSTRRIEVGKKWVETVIKFKSDTPQEIINDYLQEQTACVG